MGTSKKNSTKYNSWRWSPNKFLCLAHSAACTSGSHSACTTYTNTAACIGPAPSFSLAFSCGALEPSPYCSLSAACLSLFVLLLPHRTSPLRRFKLKQTRKAAAKSVFVATQALLVLLSFFRCQEVSSVATSIGCTCCDGCLRIYVLWFFLKLA